MNKVKILHCADLHFDTPFKELNKEFSDICKDQLLVVFKNIIDLVINEKVEILLIAGDIFDNLTVNKETIIFITEQLKRITDVYVFIAPGNHDPYNNKSFYKLVDWPSNVHLFKGNMEKIEIDKLGVDVWGAGFNNKYEHEPLINGISINKDKINIMVLHGDITAKNSKNEYNPIYIEDIEKSNMDYIALGHRHTYSGIEKSGNTYYAYSGCPQGRGFDECGEKGVIIGNVYKGGNDLSFKETSKRKYFVKEVDISGINSYYELVYYILKLCGEERKDNFYKIILKGYLEEHFNLKERILIEKLKHEFYYVKVVNKTTIKIDFENISEEYSIKGKFVNKMMEMLSSCNEEEKEIINLAIELGIKSLSKEEVTLDDN